ASSVPCSRLKGCSVKSLCSATPAATWGWAICSSSARPAPNPTAGSSLTWRITESAGKASMALGFRFTAVVFLVDERAGPAVELPRVAVAVERVLVSADGADRPAALALEREDDVADRRGLVVVPTRDERVEDEVTLGADRLPRGVDGLQGLVAFVAAHTVDLHHAVLAEGGDDVVGSA